ncbi:SCP2 sterol-binding domain-containing protein [Bailinhaonella thermotolerans]|uniref:SCP2 domain-containing protein n=1 Tax=Bailinhaonella thermotolerans TaxID=1070861 RepID=A0A3A4AS71_9ACTN|nr:SCP2 sterol-binding domain-containing protein [Bailinhaonella thermotolerans]RJL32051.1 hypothetical protein D5H75_16600 [Bailinhaonella thermotolerans]
MSDPLSQISTPEELRALLRAEGVDDEVINTFVAELGTEAVLRRVFAIMEQRFRPEKAGKKATGVAQWEITATDGVHPWTVTFADGTAKAEAGRAEKPRVVLRLGMPDFLRLVAQELGGVQAVISGRLKFSGEIMWAQAMQSWFDW